ncbi:hypothetical protein [Clostridium sp.]|uniref:hypothetical protein n=1 Tax=Clostridium sp. TaxID=1506 RepID=UPI00260D04D1|nr:hypothetical protein [Clostridium sp.]
MPELDYFRLHYLGKIWIVGLVCLVLIIVNKVYEKRKLSVYEANRKKKEFERQQILINRKNNNI